MGTSQSNYMLICNQQRLPLIEFSADFIFSLFGNLQDYYINFNFLNRFPFRWPASNLLFCYSVTLSTHVICLKKQNQTKC